MVEMVNEQKTGAGSAPWTRLTAAADRLQELYEQGRFEEVLAVVAECRATMATLTGSPDGDSGIDSSQDGETLAAWRVRESILSAGVAAAHALGRWPEALELNAAVHRSQSDRGAGEEELAITSFNDYSALLRLGEGKQARELLYRCRGVFARAENITMMGNTLSALADAEAHLGGVDAAVREETEALRLKYRGSDSEAIAVSHYNLANYLLKTDDVDARDVWAHRLAAALVRYQTDSPRLAASVQAVGRLLGQQAPAVSPLSFDDVCMKVDSLPGVRFTALFEQLPRRAESGQAAIDEIMRSTAELRDIAMRESVEAWEPIISALVAAQQPDAPPEVADVLSEALVELRQQYAWRELVPVLTRIQAGPSYHSEQTIGFLDPISATVARRAIAALAGEVTVDPTAWRALTEEV